jgi:hypothetical protein
MGGVMGRIFLWRWLWSFQVDTHTLLYHIFRAISVEEDSVSGDLRFSCGPMLEDLNYQLPGTIIVFLTRNTLE